MVNVLLGVVTDFAIFTVCAHSFTTPDIFMSLPPHPLPGPVVLGFRICCR